MIASHSKPSGLVSPGRHRGFSMTELLVVIAIIAVLAGILLVAMRGVRETGLRTQTQSTMQEFSKACDTFQIVHGFYPGIVPETILAQSTTPPLSGTENALLDMMGGAIRGDDPRYSNPEFSGPDWQEIVIDPDSDLGKIKVNVNRIGEGPVINGRPFPPYFTPGAAALGVAKGQVGPPVLGTASSGLPDLLDAWGQPIIYVRSMRSTGPLVGDASANPQFNRAAMTPYLGSCALGEFGKSQITTLCDGTNNLNPSILNVSPNNDETFAQIIRAPGFGKPGEPLSGTARGAYVLISAGPDGIYFSLTDGPGSPSEPVDDIVDGEFGNPRVVREYDDVRIFGGG